MDGDTERIFPVIARPGTKRVSLALLAACMLLAACGGSGRPTRTPVPTWTATPADGVLAAPLAVAQDTPAPAVLPVPAEGGAVAAAPTDTPAPPAPPPEPIADTATPVPPTATPEPPTSTPEPTAPPTATPTPQPTATPAWLFELEAAEKLPTETLAPNVVRVWVYAYSPSELGLPGYTVRVTHDGSALTVAETTEAGIPSQTRETPGPFTKFTNLNIIFVQPQEGSWEVQLLDAAGTPVGSPALFELSASEITRELYVRYKLR